MQVKVFSIVRNVIERIPFFLSYYRSIGVEKFYFIDNGSSDGTFEFLEKHDDVDVFKEDSSYSQSNYGTSWLVKYLNKFGVGSWCLIVDIDEFFIFPHIERISVNELCLYLEKNNFNTLQAFMLDMYSDKSIAETHLIPSKNPLHKCCYFDRSFKKATPDLPPYKEANTTKVKFVEFRDGVRNRVFNLNICLTKFPLIKYDSSMVLYAGLHYMNNCKPANLRASLLHFKFFSDLLTYSKTESVRQEHWNNASEYKVYEQHLSNKSIQSFIFSDSRKFKDSKQLINLKIMKSSFGFEAFTILNKCKKRNILFDHNFKVFGIGVHKSATKSLTRALNILGLDSVHWHCKARDGTIVEIEEVIKNNFKNKLPLLTSIDQYRGYVDWGNHFAMKLFPQIDREYPGSYFIFTTRELEAWIESRKKHVENLPNLKELQRKFPDNPWYNFNIDYWRSEYRELHDLARDYFKNRNDFIMIDLTKNPSWEEICSFLDIEPPSEDFPHVS